MTETTKPGNEDSSVSSTEVSDDDSHILDDEQIEILGELVGATDLIADDDDIGNPKPYAEVFFGSRKIHYSEPGEGLSPIWTIDTDSLFLLKATPVELADHSLTIRLYSSRNIGPLTEIKTFLGQVELPAAEIIQRCNGERFELVLQDELGDDSIGRGKLALRLKVATPADAKFVTLWNHRRLQESTILKALLNNEDSCRDKKKATLITETNETRVAGASFINAITSAFTASNFLDSKSGTKKQRVKPYSDPKRPKSSHYLSPHEIKVETRRPSENWVQAGSGKLGRLYVEVLSCHGLPNVDVGEAIGNVTDSFVALVYEDALAETPVIDDELSPHWLPWTQRAFCFGMMHPASMLYLGVFDYDIGPLANHEPLGRVAVNISNLQRDTLYTLRYSLFKSANVTDRTPTGQITIRLRVEVFDEKASLLTALKPRPNIHVNVKKMKSFKVVRYTCFGEYDGEDKFDLTVCRSYINEIFEYKRRLSYAISDSLYSLMFWRGQVEFFSIFLPIH
ncbi:Protein kinase C conserved region 2 [Fragilaria crotonensis]|nr:Protein kinase C conserved region 2 [Fragilaria crotonensis]